MMEKLAMNSDVISGQLKEALNRRILQRRYYTDKAATIVFEVEDDQPLREIQRQQRLEDEREQETDKTFKEQLKTKVNESLHNADEVSTKHLSENDDLETSVRVEMALFDRRGREGP
ncbi:unnamed protein product [Parnassius mnemosyne]|uniref:Uncharacterized protein n=1 Tax=Parnassius mnemosyne TaxID=213953 RepID=A0AAV1M3G1_9NEOP